MNKPNILQKIVRFHSPPWPTPLVAATTCHTEKVHDVLHQFDFDLCREFVTQAGCLASQVLHPHNSAPCSFEPTLAMTSSSYDMFEEHYCSFGLHSLSLHPLLTASKCDGFLTNESRVVLRAMQIAAQQRHSTTGHSVAGVRSNQRVETVLPQGTVSPPHSSTYLATFTPHTRSIPSTFTCCRTLCAQCSVSNPTLTPRKHAPNDGLSSPYNTTDCTSLHRIHSTRSFTCLSSSIAHQVLRRSHA